MNGKNNVTSCTKCSLPQSIVQLLIQSFLIFFKFVFIEMLEKLIPYIVCWYNTLYQVLPVAGTNRITLVATATRSDTSSHNRLDLIQSLMYVIGMYRVKLHTPLAKVIKNYCIY